MSKFEKEIEKLYGQQTSSMLSESKKSSQKKILSKSRNLIPQLIKYSHTSDYQKLTETKEKYKIRLNFKPFEKRLRLNDFSTKSDLNLMLQGNELIKPASQFKDVESSSSSTERHRIEFPVYSNLTGASHSKLKASISEDLIGSQLIVEEDQGMNSTLKRYKKLISFKDKKNQL